MSEATNPSTSAAPATLKPQTVTISDKRELYRCYMPFIKNGGIFVHFNQEITANKIVPGQKVFIVFSMLDSKNKIPISGKVVFITKSGIAKGFGVAFPDSPPMRKLKEEIETQVAEFAAKKEATYTL